MEPAIAQLLSPDALGQLLKLGCWDIGRELKVWFMISGRWANEGSTRRDRMASTTTSCLSCGIFEATPFKRLFTRSRVKNSLPEIPLNV